MVAHAPGRPQFLRVAIVVAIAFGLNSLGITIAGNAMIFLGSFAYMGLVFVLPATWAIQAVAVAVVPTYLTSTYPYGFIVSMLETLWLVATIRWGRRHAVLLDLTFWIAIGIPFSVWLMLDVSAFPTEIVLLLTAKQALTQLLAVGFGQFIVDYTPFASYVRRERAGQSRLRDLVFNYVFVMAAVPLIIVAVGFSQIVKVSADRDDANQLREAATRVARELDLFLQVHRESVETAAHMMEADVGVRPERVLTEIHHAHPSFLTMLVADRGGAIVHAAPAELLARAEGTSIADREYFRNARDTLKPQISGAFRGRGFGQDLLVAMSAPILAPDGSFAGIVQGAVALERFGRLAAEAGQLSEIQFALIDVHGRTIYAGSDLRLSPLANVRHHPLAVFFSSTVPDPVVYNHPDRNGVLRAWKGVGVRTTSSNLLVVAVRPQLAGLSERGDFYLLLLAVVIGVFGTAWAIGKVAAKRLSSPLEQFAQATEQQASTGEVGTIPPPSGRALPHEIELVYTAFNYLALSLRESYDELRKSNAILDQRVAERTQQLQAAYDSKSAFLAMTSHEIRTPLNAILGLTDALLEQPLAAGTAERLRTVRDSAILLMEVVNDLLDLSQAEAGRLVLRPGRVDVAELCREICRLFSARAERQGLELRLVFDGEPGPLWATTDGSRLRQVLVNLVGNALKFTRRGSVTLRCTAAPVADDSWALRLAVADTGPGIPPDKRARLFEPYYRGESTATQSVIGTGLGLPISQSLVALLGGNLEVRSELGHGTEFFFDLTVPRTAAPEPVSVAVGPPAAASLRILVADDNIANQEVMRALLEDRCAKLEVVDSGQEAIAALRREAFDVALIDLEMPGTDGIEVVRTIRGLGASVASSACRMYAVSAHPRSQLRDRCLGHGFDGYIEKPLNRQELFAILGA